MQQKAHSFDFVDAMAAACSFVWRYRRAVLALAMIPLIVKIACLVAIFGLGLENHYLRQGLVLLPAYFAEGVFLARLILMAGPGGESLLPMPPREDRRVMAATLAFVLIKIILAGLGGLGMEYAVVIQAQPEQTEGSLALFFGLLFLLGATLWGVRLTWLYIPLAQGYGALELLRRIHGLRASFVMIGAWMLCFIPLLLALVMAAGFLADAMGHSEESPSHIYRFIVIVLQSGLELLANLLATLTIAFGVHTIMQGKAAR